MKWSVTVQKEKNSSPRKLELQVSSRDNLPIRQLSAESNMEKKYKAIVVDDHEGVRDFIVEALRARSFEVRDFGAAETVIAAAFEGAPLPEQPDLIVVDLQLEQGKMQGIDLVAELADRDVSCEILVISGHLGNEEMVEAIMVGAGAAMAKPFDDYRLAIRKMESLAAIGKKRRFYRMGGEAREMDSKRLHRPVFLSYSTKDKRMANGLRRNLESKGIPVWYAPSAIEGGEIWTKSIEDGIGEATVFVALISENYLASAHCFGELIGFQSRLESSEQPKPLFLPLLLVSPRDVGKNTNFGPILREFQGIDLSSRFIDGLTLLLGRIQERLPSSSAEAAEKRPSDADQGVASVPSSKIA
jgi:FixJ family two-component response regulator